MDLLRAGLLDWSSVVVFGLVLNGKLKSILYRVELYKNALHFMQLLKACPKSANESEQVGDVSVIIIIIKCGGLNAKLKVGV